MKATVETPLYKKYVHLNSVYVVGSLGKYRRLLECVKTLGVSDGFSYWKLQNIFLRNPALILAWADMAERDADSHKYSEPVVYDMLTDWAQSLRDSLETFSIFQTK